MSGVVFACHAQCVLCMGLCNTVCNTVCMCMKFGIMCMYTSVYFCIVQCVYKACRIITVHVQMRPEASTEFLICMSDADIYMLLISCEVVSLFRRVRN